MSREVEIQLRKWMDEWVVAVDERNAVASQGRSEKEAKEMFLEALKLKEGKGQQVTDSDLREFNIEPSDLDTKAIPDDFEEYPKEGAQFSSHELAIVLVQHGFRPIGRTESHLRLIKPRQERDLKIIIPMGWERFDAWLGGFLAGCLDPKNHHEPTRIIGWIHDQS